MAEPAREESKEITLSWHQRLLYYLSPKALIRQVARASGIDTETFETMHAALARAKRVDLFPSGVNERGFILVLDKSTAFFFYQDGGHFEYDGFEIGEYADGDVTVLDQANKEQSPYDNEGKNQHSEKEA